MGSITLRVRSIVWFVTGALLSASVMLMFVNAWQVDAAPGDTDSTFVGITPCRLADTRPEPNRVGSVETLGAEGIETFVAVGSAGQCTIPADAVAVSLNVTALGASELSFLTFWPDGVQPLAASLNPAPAQPPVPNAVTVDLSAVGGFNVYNNVGTVNIVIDVNGYYTQSSLKELNGRVSALESATAVNTSGVATNAAGVAALDAAQPFTVASAPIESVGALSSATVIRSVDVTAPVAGQVAVIGSGGMTESDSGAFVGCGLMDEVALPPTDVEVFWKTPIANGFTPLSVSRVFDVAAGDSKSYSLICFGASNNATTIFGPQVTAIFTPAA